MITDFNQLDLSKRYTYSDYLTWQFDEMVEIIKGKVFRMSPAPSSQHQRVSSNLHVIIGSYVKGSPCSIFAAPFDVRLFPDKNDSVVQPDLCIICDPEKIDQKGAIGAPDWVLEILSPATASKDVKQKRELYEQAGVQEYWILHPVEQTLMIYQLVDGAYHPSILYSVEDVVSPRRFPELEIKLSEVFATF